MKAEMKAHKDWEKIRFEASIQDEIKKRRSAYGVHSDGPGPQLAKCARVRVRVNVRWG